LKYDTVIIGAGLSGLAAGIRLAHFGKKVCILEKHTRIGGLNSFYQRGSYEFETGLHAITNFAPKNASNSSTLLKLLRQLRIDYDELLLREQRFYLIKFPETELRFSNDFSEFEASISEKFSAEAQAFRKFDRMICDYDELNLSNKHQSSRTILEKYFKDPLLVNMLLCPTMFYGSPTPEDMDFNLFAILYKSIFKQGFCRPAGEGIKTLLHILKKRFLDSGGELFLGNGVASIKTSGEKIDSVITEKGELIKFDNLLSSAGYCETIGMLDNPPPECVALPSGEMAFIETVAVMDESFDDCSGGAAIVFFSGNNDFVYAAPGENIDNRSGIICFPANFKFREDDNIPSKSVRVSVQANSTIWRESPQSHYADMKRSAASEMFKTAERVIGCRDIEKNALMIDIMTPRTIYKFTGHLNGAIYGSTEKMRNGRTHFENLYVCGTDQGFLGITGAMFSGITIANIYLLK